MWGPGPEGSGDLGSGPASAPGTPDSCPVQKEAKGSLVPHPLLLSCLGRRLSSRLHVCPPVRGQDGSRAWRQSFWKENPPRRAVSLHP